MQKYIQPGAGATAGREREARTVNLPGCNCSVTVPALQLALPELLGVVDAVLVVSFRRFFFLL